MIVSKLQVGMVGLQQRQLLKLQLMRACPGQKPSMGQTISTLITWNPGLPTECEQLKSGTALLLEHLWTHCGRMPC